MNLAAYFLDHNLPARAGKVALRYEDACFTFAEMHEWSCRFGSHLRALGVREEDRVLLAMPDIPAFAAAWFGVVRIGAVVAMMNPLVPPEDWEYYQRYTRARVVITTAEFAQHVSPDVSVIVVDRDVDAIMAASADCLYGTEHPDDPAVWLFSSGSTGKPKACVHTAGDFVFNTERYAKQVLGIREDDVTLSVPKLFFGYATGTNLMFPWAVGATACLFSERPTPETVLAKIAEFRPTILTNVPTMIHRMLESPACEGADLSSIRMVLSAGEALPAELYRRWIARTGVEILDGIGSAELFHIYLSNRPGDVAVGTLGRLVPGYEAKLLDPDGREVAPGEIGTLWVRGGSNAVWYHQDREKSRATFKGDWTVTGDQFRVDADGRYVYCGRADDLLKVGGVYVSPVEVENCLLTHPQVRECAIVGFEKGGLTSTAAFVVASEGAGDALAAALQEWVKTRLAPHKYPRTVRFLDVLPRNDRGKVARAELRKTLA
ncbi:MAG: benzoate-CoA ligase family protein [Myxococcota bacterium]